MEFHNSTAPVASQAVDQSMSSSSSPPSSTNAPRVETQTLHATHNAVKAEDLSIFIGARCLLANTELKIAEQSHDIQIATAGGGVKMVQRGTCHGLVGVNGCGKSTLLRLVSESSLPVPPNWDVFLVSQHLPPPLQHCPVQEVLTASTKREQLLADQAVLEEQLSTLSEREPEMLSEASARLLRVHSELSNWDGAEKDIEKILRGLGFRGSEQAACHSSEPTINTPMSELSGGWRMKVQLTKALWLQPKLLLLDEPTNHLDFQALRWLQDRLEEYPYTTVVVSHDVTFLHGVCQEILWMKDLKLESLPRTMVSQDDLLRMQRSKALSFKFSTPQGNVAENHGLSLHGVEFSHGNSCGSRHHLRVEKEVRFSGSSRSVLLGRNGSGKSTFLDLCVGKLQPSRGSIDRTQDLKIGHYSQLTEELDQNSTDTPASYLVRTCPEELATHAGATRTNRLQSAITSCCSDKNSATHAAVAKKTLTQQKRLLEIARGVLSHFGFEGDVSSTVAVDCLSGGQKALLKFAVLSLRPAHILLLDEPTNHLDAAACDALAKGLSEFKGGVVAVTHDELLIYRLIHCNWSASELLICRGGTIWRERNFGAHCLNALKNEVHRAEETGVQPSKQPQESSEQPLQKDVKTTKISTHKELPPWLQSKRRARDKKEQPLLLESAAAKQEAVSVICVADVTLAASSESSSVPQHHSLLGSNSLSTLPVRVSESCARKCTEAVDMLCKSEVPQTNTSDAPDTWEDAAESDASTDVPEDGDEEKETAISKAASKFDDQERNHSLSPECGSEKCLSSRCMVQAVPQCFTNINAPSEKAVSGVEGCQDGRHSRFRKDLVNFNKAVAKWLRQEGNGEITMSEVVHRIASSRVSQQLRFLHGYEFNEDRFVQDALLHARKKS